VGKSHSEVLRALCCRSRICCTVKTAQLRCFISGNFSVSLDSTAVLSLSAVLPMRTVVSQMLAAALLFKVLSAAIPPLP
jgi:hypothetical protein